MLAQRAYRDWLLALALLLTWLHTQMSIRLSRFSCVCTSITATKQLKQSNQMAHTERTTYVAIIIRIKCKKKDRRKRKRQKNRMCTESEAIRFEQVNNDCIVAENVESKLRLECIECRSGYALEMRKAERTERKWQVPMNNNNGFPVAWHAAIRVGLKNDGRCTWKKKNPNRILRTHLILLIDWNGSLRQRERMIRRICVFIDFLLRKVYIFAACMHMLRCRSPHLLRAILAVATATFSSFRNRRLEKRLTPANGWIRRPIIFIIRTNSPRQFFFPPDLFLSLNASRGN